MAYTPQFLKSDTIAAGSHLNSGETSMTLTTGSFGSPTGVQLYVVDYDVPARAEIISATVAGTAVTGVTRGLTGGAAGTTDHAAGAKVGSIIVPQHFGNGLGAIASNDAWTAWTPTIGAGGSMTYDTITINKARYQQIGKMVFFEIDFTGTTGGTPSNNLTFSLPVTAKSATSGVFSGMDRYSANAACTHGTVNSTAQWGLYSYDASNLSIGAGRGFIGGGFYEAA